jgi:dCMP deaminase
MTRPTLDETGLALAHVWAKRATCPRRAVGCVLFDRDGFPIGAGFNGVPSGAPHCTEHPCPGANLPSGTGLSTCEAIHAEANALIRCTDVRAVHTCYVTTSPCVDCVKLLMGTGCRRIVFAQEYSHPAARERWVEHVSRSWRSEPATAWSPYPGGSWVHLPSLFGSHPNHRDLVERIAPRVADLQGYDWDKLDRIETTSFGPAQNTIRSMIHDTVRLAREEG